VISEPPALDPGGSPGQGWPLPEAVVAWGEGEPVPHDGLVVPDCLQAADRLAVLVANEPPDIGLGDGLGERAAGAMHRKLFSLLIAASTRRRRRTRRPAQMRRGSPRHPHR